MGGEQAKLSANELVEKFLDPLFRYACRLTGSFVDAQDLVQDTFLIAAEKIHQLRDSKRAFAWLVKILHGCRSKDLRQRLPSATVPVEELQSIEPGRPGDFDDLDPERLLAILDAMPEDYRAPLLLFYFDELRYREIAEILDLPIGTVMSRIARAKAYLRDRLAPVIAQDEQR